MIYFAYGSNMSLARLRQRAPGAHPVAVCSLAAHDLRFHKISPDGSSKCDAFMTGDPNDCVHGCVFEISAAEERVLDSVEGLGRGYDKKKVLAQDPAGVEIEAFIYFATLIDPALKPYSWYKHHVLVGATELALPAGYRRGIERIECIDDPDRERAARQWAVHEMGI